MSIFTMIYNELQNKHLMKISGYSDNQAKRMFDALDTEDVSDIILDGNTFWLEYSTYNNLTDQQHALLVNYIERKGYRYLYHLAKV